MTTKTTPHRRKARQGKESNFLAMNADVMKPSRLNRQVKRTWKRGRK